jgi:hypothetical protein
VTSLEAPYGELVDTTMRVVTWNVWVGSGRGSGGQPARPGFVLFDGWGVAGPGDGATWSRTNPWTVPTLLPDRRIDYLLTGWPRPGGVGGAVASGLSGTEPVDGVVPSDHYAVWADLRY